MESDQGRLAMNDNAKQAHVNDYVLCRFTGNLHIVLLCNALFGVLQVCQFF